MLRARFVGFVFVWKLGSVSAVDIIGRVVLPFRSVVRVSPPNHSSIAIWNFELLYDCFQR
jgi:hypothetical protein